MRIAYKEPFGELKIVDTEVKYRNDACRELMKDNCTLEFIPMNSERTLNIAVDDDGIRKNKLFNFLVFFPSSHWPIQWMVGTTVFVRTKKANPYGEIWDYEVEDLTDEDIKFIRNMLENEYQSYLQLKVMDRIYVDKYVLTPLDIE